MIFAVDDESWNDSDAIKNEEGLQILFSDFFELELVLVRFKFEEVQDDVHCEADIDHVFNVNEANLSFFEHQNERCWEQSVECKSVDDKTPDLWKSVLLADVIPFPGDLASRETVNKIVLLFITLVAI